MQLLGRRVRAVRGQQQAEQIVGRIRIAEAARDQGLHDRVEPGPGRPQPALRRHQRHQRIERADGRRQQAAHFAGDRREVGAEQRLPGDRQGQRRHLVDGVDHVARPPRRRTTPRVSGHHVGVAAHPYRVEARRDRPAARGVARGVGGEESLAEQPRRPLQGRRLGEARAARHQHVLDRLRMAEKDRRLAGEAEANGVAAAGEVLQEADRIAARPPQREQ